MKTIILLGTMAVIAVACASGKGGARDAVVTTCDSTVQLALGGKLTITLVSNITTGYSWTVASQSKALLTQTGEPVYESPSTDMDGAPGRQTFTFKADAVGQGDTLTLHYRRPWEKDKPPAQVCRVYVSITEK